jgi:SAM-dependent methyltransferase
MPYQNAENSLVPHLGGNLVEGDPATYSPLVWQYVISRFAIGSVLDLGSGRGYSSAWFHRAGLQVAAVDGLKENCLCAEYPTVHVDLTQGPVTARVDLVHCQEVVEHIDAQYLDNLLDSLTCGRFILMTNALPGQGGYHHVNEQPTEYWVEHLRSRNCWVLENDTARIRNLAQQEGAEYLGRSALLLANRNLL